MDWIASKSQSHQMNPPRIRFMDEILNFTKCGEKRRSSIICFPKCEQNYCLQGAAQPGSPCSRALTIRGGLKQTPKMQRKSFDREVKSEGE